MKPDAETAGLLKLMAESPYPPIWTLQAAKAREIHDPLTIASTHRGPEMAAVEDRDIGGGLRVRIYRPEGTKDPSPALLFFHGGGGAIGNLDTHDAICRTLADAANVVTVAVDYRLGPEHRFPAAREDAIAAWRWITGEAGSLGIDAARIAVGGDSAGGGLAAGLAQHAVAAGGPAPAFQLLIYPSVDASRDGERYPSVAENAEGYFLTAELMGWFGEQYVAPEQDLADPALSPGLTAELAGLPPALIVTAGLDPLRDEAKAYADALAAAGVAVDYRCYESTIHGFASFGRFLGYTEPAIRDWGAAVGEALT